MSATPPPTLRPIGDAAIAIIAPDGADPEPIRRALLARRLRGVRDVIAGTRTVVVHLDPAIAWRIAPDAPSPAAAIAPQLAAVAAQAIATPATDAPRAHELPACYDHDLAPDLADVAACTGLTIDMVIARHLAATYTVGLVGFLPGFAYLHGLDPALALPRRDTPRVRVPGGSVGLADRMTGVYPGDSPGGWHLVARVPVAMFDAQAEPPARLARGDTVRFVRVDRATFEALVRERERTARAALAPATRDATLLVERPGLLTIVQDAGRWGHHAAGVGQGGWFDDVAPRLANALVGNREDAAVLECTLAGPVLVVARDALVAITGADMTPTLDGAPVAMHRPLLVRAGQRLVLGGAATGCRTYVAIDGGIDVAHVLGSASTQLRGAFGGHAGRALRAGDALASGTPSPVAGTLRDRGDAVRDALRSITPPSEFTAPPAHGARLGLALHDTVVGALADATLARPWTVAAASDRMGLRLDGPSIPLAAALGREPSEPTVLGTVQLPPDGTPIVLGPDRQVTGGYHVVGTVVGVSRTTLAQLRPGARVAFVPVSVERAARAFAERERRLALACGEIARAVHRVAHG